MTTTAASTTTTRSTTTTTMGLTAENMISNLKAGIVGK